MRGWMAIVLSGALVVLAHFIPNNLVVAVPPPPASGGDVGDGPSGGGTTEGGDWYLPYEPGDGSAGGGHSPHPADTLVSHGLPGFSAETRLPLQFMSTVTKVLVRDFNNDHNPDIMAEDRYGMGGLYLFLGDGTGAYGPPVRLPNGGMDPNNMEAGDFNLDGWLDVAVTNVLIDTVTIYLNAGDGVGTFVRSQDIAVGSLPEGIIVANVVEDAGPGQAPDLVIALRAGKLQVLVGANDGSGSFSLDSTLDYEIGGTPIGLAVGDFDADSKIDDVCVANFALNSVSVHLSDGTGHFTDMAGSPFPVGMGPHTPVVTDLNNDSKPDIVVGNFYDTVVTILTWTGDHFDRGDVPAGPAPIGVAVCEFAGDGKKSLVATNYNTESDPASALAFVAGTSSGGFEPAVFDDAGFGGINIALGDLDKDGDQDLVIGFGNSGYLGVYFNTAPPVNHDPTADATLTPSNLVSAIGASTSVVALNGTASTDPDGDPLSWSWAVDGVFAGTGPIFEASMLVNLQHTVTLTVTDGRGGSDTDTILVTIESPAAAATSLIEVVGTIQFTNDTSTSTFLTSSLAAASSSFAAGNVGAGVNKLQAFQNKLRAKSGKSLSAAEAQELINLAQEIIDSSQP